MDRALRLWSAVSWWLVPLAILVFGAVDLTQNGSLSSEGSAVTFPGQSRHTRSSCCWSRSAVLAVPGAFDLA